jgi:hypothetical protein
MITAINGRGETIGVYNDDGTVYQDPTALGVYENDIYFPKSGTGSGITFSGILGGVVNVLQVLFPTGVKGTGTTTYDPYTPTNTPPPAASSNTFSGLGWVLALLAGLYFLFSGKKKK